MTWIAAIALAAICNSVMDSVEGFRIQGTVFKNKNPKYWNRQVAAEKAKMVPFTHYRWDAWHNHKSLMIIFMCVAALCYHYYPVWTSGIWWIDLVIMGIAWDIPFNLFFNKIWKK
jgi:hypothetical protein